MLRSFGEQWCLTMIYRVMSGIPFSASNRKNLSQLLHVESTTVSLKTQTKGEKTAVHGVAWCISSLHFLAFCLLFEADH